MMGNYARPTQQEYVNAYAEWRQYGTSVDPPSHADTFADRNGERLLTFSGDVTGPPEPLRVLPSNGTLRPMPTADPLYES